MSTTSSITHAIGRWYAVHGRDLPWRRTRDPYLIWLSEVILQQTRVEQGKAYWHRFAERWPTVQALAQAGEDEVLKAWQGLGYYSRARNLLATARLVAERYEGVFPSTYEGLKALKGVGDYTAAAIGSICFDLRTAVVDGNVYRVLARLFGDPTPVDSAAGAREFQRLALSLLDRHRPGDHNQAMMELGATVCTPRDPNCRECPVRRECVARREGRQLELPVKAGRTKVRTRHFNYLYLDREGSFFLRKRTGRDIWRALYEFPLVETVRPVMDLARDLPEWEQAGELRRLHGPVTHVLSHQRIEAVLWELVPNGEIQLPPDWIAVAPGELERFAVPRLIERWLLEEPLATKRSIRAEGGAVIPPGRSGGIGAP